ncbi:hypothetical protein A4H97_23420 [Niastella yeongjuensis]|uniref:RagB/SusD family nutrient uptake outer membrane protein n=1 Tax=Niastella yeongjuensis TaxID=354355 RepID=A0A1V9F561_9BACT|nr:RagB/SusD family nutrient uptake outer membrane protein [Niastella yeongjuensis]OQP53402.1 hypothetical protein A4H97_23420 [Niastella yeongjuensis]SEP13204.1 SusD family protein [Niastella yeongjuensis]
MKSGRFTYLVLLGVVVCTGCKKYMQVPLPTDKITGSAAYANDNAASGVISGIYSRFVNARFFEGSYGIPCCTSLYTDDMVAVKGLVGSTDFQQAFYTNALNESISGWYWSQLYSQIYVANVAIENIRNNTNLFRRDQWLGEALFLRGFMYFYLTNLFGKAALAISSDYHLNNQLVRSPQNEVYSQILKDLKEAQTLLPVEYRDANGNITLDRGRPNKYAVTALLARVYLYTKDWANAEAQASAIINSGVTFQLEAPAAVFGQHSREMIWGLAPVNFAVSDAPDFLMEPDWVPGAHAINATLSTLLVNSFETNDVRYTNWVGKATSGTPAMDYYYPAKYKIRAGTTANEYLAVFRLAEQYLIRAEARARQDKITGGNSAESDVNVIRNRAGLSTTTASDKPAMLNAIMKERRVEFFTEMGHRFFDLKRTDAIDGLMAAVAPQKGSAWLPFMQYWPIPKTDILANPNLAQTPGY